MDHGNDIVRQFYDQGAQQEWARLDRHPFEFLFTTYMMEKYIRPGHRVLDIGGGPGRYAIHFAKMGCDVTLVDLSPGNVALAREKAREAGVTIQAYASDCLLLDQLDLGTFDHVFLMGPLYHIQDRDLRIRAVEIALDHLKPGCNLYCSFIQAFAGVLYDLKNGPGFLGQDLSNPDARHLVQNIADGEDYVGPAFTSACFTHQRNILPFMSRFGLEKLHLFGQESFFSPNENQLLTYPKEELDQWIELGKLYLEVPEFLSYADHAMYIGRKPE